jgi:hypothetical protein
MNDLLNSSPKFNLMLIVNRAFSIVVILTLYLLILKIMNALLTLIFNRSKV